MTEAWGSEDVDTFFEVLNTPEAKETTRAAAENIRLRHQGKTRVVRKADLDPRLDENWQLGGERRS